MGFWDRLLKAEQNIRRRVESAFGHGAAQTPLEMRREIIEQVESRIVVDTAGTTFPFVKVFVQLQPTTEALRDVFESAFLQDQSLRADILEKLRDSRARYPPELEIVVELRPPATQDAPESAHLFQLDFIKPDPSHKIEVPETILFVVKGSAEQPEYRLKKERILVGRLAEVLDREGRLVRKNDVVFLDNGEDINSTVGRIHSRIWFDVEKGNYSIIDEASRYGTRIIREGRSIEVPGGDSRGVRLRSGDEIYFGQACLRFEIVNER
jgi:hypothetical protein